MTFEEALRLLSALEDEDVDYVLIGSMAMAANAIVRATRDIDLMVSPEPENVERLRRALRRVYDDDDIDDIRAADLSASTRPSSTGHPTQRTRSTSSPGSGPRSPSKTSSGTECRSRVASSGWPHRPCCTA